MTIREVDKQLEEIYKERNCWYPVRDNDYDTIQYREGVFLKEVMLYNLRDAKKSRDGLAISFYSQIHGAVCSYLNSLQKC